MQRDVTIRLADGRSIVLVDASAIEAWREDRARRQLRAAVEDNPSVGHDLVRFADRECLVSSWDATLDEAIDAIAHALDRGMLAAIRLVDAMSGLRPWTGGVQPTEWDDLRPLADLRRPEPPPAPKRPMPPTVPPAWVDPRDAWTSFEVVDDRGVLADGEFRGDVDGQTHEGALERAPHSFRDLSTSATASVQLTALSFASTTMHVDGPVPGGTPTKPSDAPVPRTSFEVVDEAGQSLVGRYVVLGPADELGGPLGGVITIEAPAAAKLRVMLESNG